MPTEDVNVVRHIDEEALEKQNSGAPSEFKDSPSENENDADNKPAERRFFEVNQVFPQDRQDRRFVSNRI